MRERYVSKCGFRKHPDTNDDTTIEWSKSKKGKAIITTGSEKGDTEMRMRWDETSKHLVLSESKTRFEI